MTTPNILTSDLESIFPRNCSANFCSMFYEKKKKKYGILKTFVMRIYWSLPAALDHDDPGSNVGNSHVSQLKKRKIIIK